MDNEQCPKKLKLEEVPTVNEGKAQILVTNEKVFYNPVQEFNRDLSIAVLTIFAKDYNEEVPQKNKLEKDDKISISHNVENQRGITILEALSATGLRSIRYAKEVEGVRQIIANDISAKAVDSIRQNVLHNGVENLVTPYHEDATLLMYQRRRNRFDAVDLDPYGCPSMYLDGAVQCVSDGGILLVTATDVAILAGNVPETCYYKYGAISIKSKSCHEIALRILLQCIASYAGRYGRYIVPLLSISVDFYIRVFVKVFTSHDKCKENSNKIGMLYQCNGCESMNFQPLVVRKAAKNYKLPSAPIIDQLCKHCQHRQHMGGPIWLGPLHDHGFVSRLLCNLNNMELGTSKRMEGVLTVIHEELDIPLYYNLDRLMSIVRCHVPPMLMFRSALLNAGYKVSYSHASKISIKTDAPNDVIWDIVRAWEKKHPVKREKLAEDSPATRILNASSTMDISLAMHPLANPISRQRHLSRFQQNPTANWGPGVRSRTRVDLENKANDSKKVRNQNKNNKKKSAMVEQQIVQ
ncbi:putative N(2),N(2)-dimethylguanosine tRNA methyltransferase [Trachymyrmex zeteki]|uniref:tRNA (guanine(26)-N(2))-dimethyltransferase n=1 Tax=Mycetomoellerius zeteki TaxID=64791 RepID=A0A151WRC9_9HYME|nr:PREDICTED: probable tRNA (guanine(26)-N(2))-dimethyltransferase [Trachymyrmex zeteki]XP_018310705.1 PREDICTED: probable tRNA (guanine(26)-N(2))-dimethyltransferase [Trachymyrmex zeteki]KYQ50363.1 putative N(2),N(2)-dimethylguanosine tRNA methyltransferase [Trachymyrmex zeteki]